MTYLRYVAPADVCDVRSFASYAQQTIGTKYPNVREMVTLTARANAFFAENPHADWNTLVRTVQYIRSRRRRVAMPWGVITFVPTAFKDGFLPELDPRNHTTEDPYVESAINDILTRETDPWWVSTLSGAIGVETRRDVLRMYREYVSG